MNILKNALRYLVITGVFVMPFICLLVTTNLFFPYITGKNFTFRVIVEIISAAWLALALVDAKYRPRRSWILGAFAIFVIIMAIADAQGVNPFKSFWSNYERMDGWITLIHLLALITVASSVLTTEKLWRWFWHVTVGVSLFVSVYGFLQIAGAVSLGEGSLSGLTARIDATFGNPIYLAVYMLFNIFIAALLMSQEGKQRFEFWERITWVAALGVALIVTLIAAGASPLLWIALIALFAVVAGLVFLPTWWLLSLIIVFDTVALLFTGTRGTTLGLIGGTGLAIILYAFFTPDAPRRMKQFTVGLVVVGILGAGGLWLARGTAFVHSVGFLDRLASISSTDTTIASRFINMSIAWQGVKERPILGWGQEDYAIVFDKYYDPRMYADEPWFDRVHDIIFDWWVTGGTLGLLSYLSILGVTFWTFWRKNKEGKYFFTAAERSILTGMIAGYFIHNLTVFDNITSYILFASVLSYVIYRTTSADETTPRGRLMPEAALPFATVICALLAWGVVWFANANALAENTTLLNALMPQSSPDINLSLFAQAASYGTYGTQEVREQLIQAATQVANSSSVSTTTKQQFFQVAKTQMALQEQASPLDARFPLFLGILEDAYGRYPDALASLERAHQDSPDKQTILFQIAMTQQAMGNNAGALATYKQAYELEPQYSDAALYYAAALIGANQDQLAAQILAPFIPSGVAADQRITSAYASQHNYAPLVPIWRAYVKANPTNVQGYFTLAAVYVATGDNTDAIASLKQAAAVEPAAASQVNSLIQQIQNGTAKVQ